MSIQHIQHDMTPRSGGAGLAGTAVAWQIAAIMLAMAALVLFAALQGDRSTPAERTAAIAQQTGADWYGTVARSARR